MNKLTLKKNVTQNMTVVEYLSHSKIFFKQQDVIYLYFVKQN